MFGMSGTEMIIILILALLLLGPDKLPEMAKLAGKTMRDWFQSGTAVAPEVAGRDLTWRTRLALNYGLET